MARRVPVPAASAAATGAYAPQTQDTAQPLVSVSGLTVVNTSTTSSATVIVRDGGSSGPIVAAATAPAGTATVPGVADVSYHHARDALNGLYFEVDGGTVETTSSVWVS